MQINRRNGDVQNAPAGDVVIGEGDGIVLMGRPNRAELLTALFDPRQKVGVRG